MIHLPAAAEDTALLIMRLIVAWSFLAAAWYKNKNIRKFAKNNGLPVPAAYIVMCVEFAGGTLLALGIIGQIAAFALMVLMLGTMRLHIFKWKSPYWAQDGGWEYDLMLFAMASIIAVLGPGPLSLWN